jgi:parallel beta-helix repeat protein
MKNLSTLAAACLACIAAAGAISAHTWHVRNDGSGDAPTIQAAIDSAAAGDSVLVGPGTYTQSVIRVMSKANLVLASEGGAETTVLRSSSKYVMELGGCDWVTVRGFLFESGQNGIWLYMSHDCFIEESVFRNFSGSAVSGGMSGFISLSDNVLYSNGAGISFDDGSSAVTLTRNTIAHNTTDGFFSDGPGLYLYANIIVFNGYYGVDAFCNVYQCNDVFGNGTNYMTDPTGSNGNISSDPLFCGASPELSGNYDLQSSSPCAPGNHPGGFACALIGRGAVKCDVSVEKKSWGSIKAMYR